MDVENVGNVQRRPKRAVVEIRRSERVADERVAEERVAEEQTLEIGVVKWFNNAKGWGFLCRQDGSEVFVHYSQLEGDGYRTLTQGQEVRFVLRTGPRGHFAERVTF